MTRALLALLLTQTAASFGNYALVPLVPLLRQDFGLSHTQVGLFVSALYLGVSVASLPSGLWADRIGVRPMLLATAGAVGGVTALEGFAPGYLILLGLLWLCGATYAGTTPATNKGIMHWFPVERRGLAMGVKQTGVTLGNALAAAALPALGLWWGWQRTLTAAGAVVLVAASVAYLLYREGVHGSATVAPTVRALWGLPPLRLLCLVIVVFIWVQFAVFTYTLLYLHEAVGLSLVAAGWALSLLQVGGVVGRILWGLASDRLWGGRRQPGLTWVAGAGALTLGALAGVGQAWPVWAVVALCLLVGGSVAGWNGLYLNLVAEVAGSAQAASATGLALAVGYLGAIVGTPLFGAFVDATGSYRLGWSVVAGALLAVAALFAFIRLEEGDSERVTADVGL